MPKYICSNSCGVPIQELPSLKLGQKCEVCGYALCAALLKPPIIQHYGSNGEYRIKIINQEPTAWVYYSTNPDEALTDQSRIYSHEFTVKIGTQVRAVSICDTARTAITVLKL